MLIKLRNILIGCLVLFAVPACTDLDEEVYGVYTDENFPTTPEQYAALTGPIYVAAQKFFDNNYFDMQETATDEVIVPTRGGDWFDGGKWRDMHFQAWTPSHELMRNSWDWGFNAIGTCNRVLQMFESAPESEGKDQTVAEIRTMRAWYYYLMMDSFGNIPLVTTFDDQAESPEQVSREVMFNFIATELEESLEFLTEEVSEETYGRPTKWMAHTLLAKLYLNAEVYTGTQHWDDVITHTDAVINANKYQLGDYFAQFMPDNGPQDKEPIFSIPFDAVRARGNLLFNKVLHYGHRETYGLTTDTWNGWTTSPAFFDKFDDEDLRKNQWLYGQQQNSAGGDLVYNGIEVVLDPYFGPGTDYTDFDLGGEDDKGRLVGARNIKYYPDANAVSNNANNDFVVFRYADVLLMKAEALVRKGETVGEAVHLFNQIRERAFGNDSHNLTEVTLNDIYDERGREFAMEMTRRIDMIRFGTFLNANVFKPAKTGESYRTIFPIPTDALATNPNLVQNDDY